MTAIEVTLLLIGVVFIIGSFFIMEKLSPTELSRVAELSEDELRIVMDRELEIASAKISDMADQAVDLSVSQIQRKLEKDTNEKIKAISEYSNSAMQQLQKFNNEVTFLYSMLGDKHKELNDTMAQLQELIAESQTMQAQTAMIWQQYQERQNVPEPETEYVEPEKDMEEPERSKQTNNNEMQQDMESVEATDEENSGNIREEILERYHSGEDLKNIARDLGLGYGEVKLIVELYKGEENL